MPKFNVKTTSSRSVWKSPDGQREIFEVVLDYEGQPLSAKTYSKIISNIGWAGEVETTEKQGRLGVETFVKQPPKEGGYGGGYGTSAATTGAAPAQTGTKYQPKDEAAIKAMWSIGQAVQMAKGTEHASSTNAVEDYAKLLFAMVDRIKVGEIPLEVNPLAVDAIVDVEDGPLDMSGIDDIFGTNSKESAWPKN